MLYREAGQFKTTYAEDMAIFPIRQDRMALAILLGIAFIGVPLLADFDIWPFGSDYLLRAILLPFLILALAAIGVNILVGYCGQISLGSGAFMAIGAYSAYKLGTGALIFRLPGLASRFRSRRCPYCYLFCSAGSRRRLSASSSVFPVCGSRASIWRLQHSQRSSSLTGCSCGCRGSPIMRRQGRSMHRHWISSV